MGFEFPIERTKRLYPERSSAGIEEKVKILRKLDQGEIERIELSDDERERLLLFEDGLGARMEEIYSISSPSETFYLDYFSTEEGKARLAKILGIEEVGGMQKATVDIILRNRNVFRQLSSVERKKIAGQSETFSDRRLFEELLTKYKRDGQISVDQIHAPKKVSILLDPGASLKKSIQLRELKAELKKVLINDDSPDKLALAKSEIASLYIKRINEIIADQFGQVARVRKMADTLGMERLTEDERALLEVFHGVSSLEENLSRFDKFLHGSGKEVSSDGMYKQVSQEIIEYAEKIEEEYIKNALEKERLIREKGLDVVKLYAKDIDVVEFSELANEVLEEYGIKSSLPESEYDSDRAVPAPDGKWQFIARPEYKSMTEDGKQKVVRSGSVNKNIIEVIATLLGHEIEGHVIQNENKSKIGLRLFQRVGAGRSQIFFESGAMYNENVISTEAFGFKNVPHGHYVKAMVKKLEGGNYIDCVEVFFKSAQKITEQKKEKNMIGNELFWSETEENLRTAINRCKRLFQNPLDWDKSSRILSKSKDTVYIEQLILMEKLQKEGLEKYAYVGGANIATLFSLAKIGILDPSKIKKPELYALKIWDRIKHRFTLEQKA